MAEDQLDPVEKVVLDEFRKTQKAVNDQMQELQKAATIGRLEGITKEAAILSVCTARESAAKALMISDIAVRAMSSLQQSITGSAAILTGEIGTFTKKADEGTNRLADWTRALVFATWGLAVAALIAAGIQAYAIWVAAPQIINVVRP